MDELDLAFVDGSVFRAGAARTDALGVVGGRIVALGSNAVADRIGRRTEVVDLAGRMVCPGFQDAHVHPVNGGLKRLQCDLLDIRERSEAEERIAAYAATSGGPWVLGGGWKYHWFERGEPSARLLDRLVPDGRPAYLPVADGHSGWANTAALAAAGITAATPDPDDGRIVRHSDGTPQGTLHEGAMTLVERVVPASTAADLDAALLEGQAYLLSFGITAWQDAWVTPEIHDAYCRAVSAGRLVAGVRGALWWSRDEGLGQLDAMRARREQSAGTYAATSVKFMLDGVCENFTALMLDPYLDDAGAPTHNHGIPMLDPAAVPDAVAAVVGAGFQPHFHAIGDAAVRMALDAVEHATRLHGSTGARPHVAHIQVIHPDDLPRFAELGVTANAQALWACNDDAMTQLTTPFLGPERAARQYPFGSLARSGARLAMGSDWSVSSPNVLEQIAVAVSRRCDGDAGPFLPDETLSIGDALTAFTQGSAYVNAMDDRGSIRVGAPADLVVLDSDLGDADAIADIAVDLTLIEGRVVYSRA